MSLLERHCYAFKRYATHTLPSAGRCWCCGKRLTEAEVAAVKADLDCG